MIKEKMVEALTPPPPIQPIVTLRPVEVVTPSAQNSVQTQTPLAVLASGSILQGFVLSRDGNNNPVLRTQYGDLQVQSDVFLKTGAQVAIQITANGNGQARILTVDGQSLQNYAAQNSRGLTQDTVAPLSYSTTQAQTQQAQAAVAPEPIQNNAYLTAVLLNRSGQPNALTNNPSIAGLLSQYVPPVVQKLAAGSAFQVTLLDLQFPNPEDLVAVPPSTPQSGQPQAAPQLQSPQAQQAPANPALDNSLNSTRAAPLPAGNSTTPLVANIAQPGIQNPTIQNFVPPLQNGTLPNSTPQPLASNIAPPPQANALPNTPLPQPANVPQNPTFPNNFSPFTTNAAPTATAPITPQAVSPTASTNNASPLAPNQPATANSAATPASPSPADATPPAPPATSLYDARLASAAYQQFAPRPAAAAPTAPIAPAQPAPANTPPTLAPNTSTSPTVGIASATPTQTSIVPPASAPVLAPASGQNIPSAFTTTLPAASQTQASALQSATLATPATTSTPPTPSLSLPPPATGMQAAVIGHEADGATVLNSAAGTIKIYTPQPLPTNTVVTFDIPPDAEIIAAPPTLPAQAQAPAMTLHSPTIPWVDQAQRDLANAPSNDTLNSQALSAAVPPAQAALHNLLLRLPNTGNNLTDGLLSFITAVKMGDIRQLLDKRTLDGLTSQLPKLAAQITSNTEEMKNLWNNSPLDQWTGMLIPIVHNNQLDHARFFVRDDESDSANAGGAGGGKRFLVEVNMSQLGGMQFDGFVRQTGQKQFDLVVRSMTPIEPGLAQDIRTIFDNTAQTTGFGGYLSFQHGPQHFVRPNVELKPTAGPDLNTIVA